MSTEQKYPKKRNGLLVLVLALVVITALGFFFWTTAQADGIKLGGITLGQATSTPTSEYKTTTVRRSDISNSISGSGTVITAQSVDLGFSVDGTVSEVNVQPGDQVKQGQVLATLGNTADLKQKILDQQLGVQVAQNTLDDLQSNGAAALAQAQADQAAAEKAYADAQTNAHTVGQPRCSVSKTQDYYFQYLAAQKNVDIWEARLNNPNTGYGRDYILQNLQPLQKKRDQIYADYTYCQGYTEKEIQTSHANLQLAKARLDQANTNFANMLANAGVDPVQLAIAQAALENAKMQLASAQSDLAGTTITAPMDGTVTAVNGKIGDDAGTAPFITLSNMEQPLVQVNIDETDLENFAVGCAANVTFDSLPGQNFAGTVTQVSPVMVTVNNASMAQGLVDLQKKEMASGKPLSIGLTGSVEVTCSQVKNALTVPAQALYEPQGQSAYVYVLSALGKPEKRTVVVGLKTVASAQITSGLSEGERIITSQIEGK